MSRDNRIQLGTKVKDSITGVTGIVVAVTDWLNGCRRVTIQPQELKDGRPVEGVTFDVEQLEYVDAGLAASKSNTGGPAIAPTRNPDPK